MFYNQETNRVYNKALRNRNHKLILGSITKKTNRVHNKTLHNGKHKLPRKSLKKFGTGTSTPDGTQTKAQKNRQKTNEMNTEQQNKRKRWKIN